VRETPAALSGVCEHLQTGSHLDIGVLESVALDEVAFEVFGTAGPLLALLAQPRRAGKQPHGKFDVAKRQAGPLRLHGTEAQARQRRELDAIEGMLGVKLLQRLPYILGAVGRTRTVDIVYPASRRQAQPIQGGNRDAIIGGATIERRAARRKPAGAAPYRRAYAAPLAFLVASLASQSEPVWIGPTTEQDVNLPALFAQQLGVAQHVTLAGDEADRAAAQRR
jgi:hypothetical protein